MKFIIFLFFLIVFSAIQLRSQDELGMPKEEEMSELELEKSQENLKNLEAQLKALESKKNSLESDGKPIENGNLLSKRKTKLKK